MKKPGEPRPTDAPAGAPADAPTHAPDDDVERDAQGRRRVRLRPREGREHRYHFARRWETRRQARKTNKIWLLIGMDFGVVLLIYLLAREVIRRLGGG